jgi:PAS domain S-box-containing protein
LNLRLEKVIEDEFAGYWDWDFQNDTVTLSNKLKAVLGYAPHEIDDNGESIRALILPEDQYILKEAIDKLCAPVEPATSFNIELRYRHKNGSTIWIKCMGSVVVWASASPARVMGYHIDVTSAKETEKRLAEQRQMMDDFFDLGLDLLCIIDMEGHFVRVNAQWEKVLGYGPEEIIQHKYIDLVHPADLPAALEVAHALAAGQQVNNHTNRARCRDGSYRHLEWQMRPKNGLVYAAGRDITIRVKAQQDFARMLNQNASIINAMSEGVLLQDSQGAIIQSNQAAEQILGLAHDQLVGRRSVDKSWRVVHEDGTDFPGEARPPMQSLRTGQPVFNEVAGVHQPSGELVWMLVNSVPIVGPDGQVDSVVTSLTNITELKAKEAKLQAVLQKALEQKTKLENFAHIVSHNLRAHSGNIASLVGMLAGAGPADDQPELLAYLAKASGRLQQTIADLNEIVDAQRDEETCPILLGDFFHQVLDSVATDLKHKSVELVVDIPPTWWSTTKRPTSRASCSTL